MQNFGRKPFKRASADEVIEFCLQNRHHPNHSHRTIMRFLVELTSSEELVFDYYHLGQRVLTAVLVDKVQNPSNFAILEVLGVKKILSNEELLTILLTDVKEALPHERSGIECGTHQKSILSEQLLSEFGFTYHYTIYEMATRLNETISPCILPINYHWKRLNNDNFAEYYQVLKLAFTKNLETSIPPLSEMRDNFNTVQYPPYLLYEAQNIVGFSSIAVDDPNKNIGEIHMIGVHPHYRQKGLGNILLTKALSELIGLGVSQCKLTVAATNENALYLYKKFGFQVVDQDICFRYQPVYKPSVSSLNE